jgi:PhnB protein
MITRITPYLLLDRKAKEAVDFYVDVFGAEVDSCQMLKDWPQELESELPKGYENNVMHAHLIIGDSWLMLADALPGQKVTPGSAFTLMVDLKKVSETEKIYHKLSEDGEVITELTETSYSPAYGQVKDRYGIEWQLYTEFPETEEEE